MNMICFGLCLLFIILLLLFHSFQTQRVLYEQFYTSNAQLRKPTAEIYRNELKTLIGVLAYRIKRLLPDETESQSNQQQSDTADEISNDLNVDKYKMPETFQNPPPTAAFNTIKKRARTPKQVKLQPATGRFGSSAGGSVGQGVGGEDNDLYANSSPETRAMYSNVQTLPEPVQIYLMASRDWYVFYNQSLSVAVNALLRQRNTMLEAKNKQKEQREETTQQNKKRMKETTEIKSDTLNRYSISE